MEKNFAYIQAKDALYERQAMNVEDKPINQIDFEPLFESMLVVNVEPFKKSQQIMIAMSKGKYKVRDEEGGFIGLGFANSGIKVPIQLKSQHPASKKGIGFIYLRYKIYPNRRRESIKWVKSYCG
jgi:hypothetical protein